MDKYDTHTIKECKDIKESKFIAKKEILKGQKVDISKIIKTEKEKDISAQLYSFP